MDAFEYECQRTKFLIIISLLCLALPLLVVVIKVV
jgi:hypothetical protein